MWPASRRLVREIVDTALTEMMVAVEALRRRDATTNEVRELALKSLHDMFAKMYSRACDRGCGQSVLETLRRLMEEAGDR